MKLKNKTILITGGAGFIGSHLAERLALENRVILYDNLASSVLAPSYRHKNISIIRGDILDAKQLEKAMKQIDILFHMAAACVRLSLSDPKIVHETNATGTLNVFLAAKKYHVPKVIHISSSEVYGSATQKRMNETHPIDPTTVYGMSKYIGEAYARYFHVHEGVPTVIVRPFNTYGPRSHMDGVYGEVIPRFVVRALVGKPPIIFGTGKQTRDFTYIDDTVDGIICATQSEKAKGEIINIARGEEVSINSLAYIIIQLTERVTGAGGPPRRGPLVGILGGKRLAGPARRPPRPNDVLRHAADITKAKKMLGFVPKVSLTDGLQKYIDWLKITYPDIRKLEKLIPEQNW